MLPLDKPEYLVIGAGVQYSVRDFVDVACAELGMKFRWQGEGVNEVGYLDGQAVIKVDPCYYRPAEVETLLGDPAEAIQTLGWTPKTKFEDLVAEIVRDELIKNQGYKAMDYNE